MGRARFRTSDNDNFGVYGAAHIATSVVGVFATHHALQNRNRASNRRSSSGWRAAGKARADAQSRETTHAPAPRTQKSVRPHLNVRAVRHEVLQACARSGIARGVSGEGVPTEP
jgi:hypothetical protein